MAASEGKEKALIFDITVIHIEANTKKYKRQQTTTLFHLASVSTFRRYEKLLLSVSLSKFIFQTAMNYPCYFLNLGGNKIFEYNIKYENCVSSHSLLVISKGTFT